MRCRLVFLIGLLLIINNAFAQWHFSVSISYNSDCGGSFSAIQASAEVAARIGIVEQLSAKTYNSQEDCEAERRACTMNYSSSGCYIRTSTTPCQGNVGGGSGGGFYGEPSLHNNLAIGSDYFSQNEVHNVENGIWENEMLVQNDVLNKNWYNAVGAKTGDKDYDNLYIRQIRNAYDRENDNKSDMVLRKVRNKSIQDDNLQTTKFKARIQQHINNRLRPKNKQFNVSLDNSGAVLSDVYDDIKVGSKVIKEGNKELVGLDFLTNEIKKYLGILDDAEKSSEIGFDLADGNRDEAASKFYSLLKDKMIDPATDFIANSFGDNWTKMIKNIVTFAKFNSKETPGLAKRTFNRISEANRTGDYKKLDRENNKEMARFGYKVNKTTKKMIKN